MNRDLAREVAAMLNIENTSGIGPLYRAHEWRLAPGSAIVFRDVIPERVVLRIDGHGDELKVGGVAGHPRGFRFKRRDNRKPEERFDWSAIHKRCSALAEEALRRRTR